MTALLDKMKTHNGQVGFFYFAAFIATMRREWFGIDRLRLDKYLMLVRKLVGSMFGYMHARRW